MVTIDDVLEALSTLDHHPKRPAGWQTRTNEIGRAGWRGSVAGDRQEDRDDDRWKFALLRTHRKNIARYRRLLKTKLTECERQFVEMRLSEEWSATEKLAASTFYLAFQIPAKLIETSAPETI
jgi:hypothetical protein